MPGKCCVFNCRSNYDNGPKETVFFTDEKKDYDLRQRWIRFVNKRLETVEEIMHMLKAL